MDSLDTQKLKQIIENVEDSLEAQALHIGSAQKAALITELYSRSQTEGAVPGKMSTDQAVWMAG